MTSSVRRFAAAAQFALAALLPLALPAQTVRFEVEAEITGCGGVAYGPPGGTARLNVAVYIFNRELNVQSWTFAVAAEGLDASVAIERCNRICQSKLIYGPGADGDEILFQAPVVFDPQHEPISGPLAGKGPQGPGFGDTVVLLVEPDGAVTLPRGRSLVSRFQVDVKVPSEPEGAKLRLYFKDGMQATATGIEGESDPWINSVALGATVFYPELGTCEVTLRPAGRVLPGDANADGRLNLTDAILFLLRVVVNRGGGFPCGNGSAADPSNQAILDADGSGNLSLHDAIYLLTWIFAGGQAHRLGSGCVAMPACPEVCAR